MLAYFPKAIVKQLLAWFGISLLFLSACKPTPPTLPAYTPTPPIASQTAYSPPTASPTYTNTPPVPTPTVAVLPSPSPAFTPTTEKLASYTGWTSYPDIKYIKDLAFDQKGNLWAVGPDGAVMLQPDGTQRRFTTKDGLPSNDLLSVAVDSHGALWFGSRGAGAARFDGKDWQTFTTLEGLGGNKVAAIVDYTGYDGVLFGTQNGLSVYEKSWGNFSGPSYLPDDAIRAMVVTPRGSVWVGTRKGVIDFGPSETYTTADGLASDVVNAMVIAPDCNLWLGTSRGVSRYDESTWTSYTTADGLAGDEVSAAAATLDGAVWFGTQAGVSRFDGHTWTTYTTADGLANNDVLSIAVAPDDSLWFGTAGGLSHYSPSFESQLNEPGRSQGGTSVNGTALQVVYLKDGNLWLWTGGAKRQLIQTGRASSLMLSGDGRQVAFTRINDYLENELWTINQDGSGERMLVGPDELAALASTPEGEQAGKKARKVVIFHYDWVPGQGTIAFDTRQYLEGPGAMYYDDLRLVDAETGELTTLLPPGRGGRFTYSPDGAQIAIVAPTSLSLVNADGSHWRGNLLEYPAVLAYGEAPYYPLAVWSADSQYLILALPPRIPMSDPPQPATLWKIPADGSPAIRLGSTSPSDLFVHSAAFSPDLTRLAFLTRTGEPVKNLRQLHIADVDGTDDKVVLEGLRILFWGWSQDGQHFIYSLGDPETWYISGSDGEQTPLSFHPEDLTWVSGDSFLHIENLGCALELRLTNLNGDSLVIDRMWKTPVSFDFMGKTGSYPR